MRGAVSTHDALWQHPISQQLAQDLQQFAPDQPLVLACSGGLDSMLLAVLLQVHCPTRLRVLHVNHQLHPHAGQWAAQVAHWCSQHHVPCQVLQVQVGAGNLERAAREARYQALFAAMQPHEVLVLAHHQQDQAETVWLRVMQGSGLRGLTGMRQHDQRAGRHLWRPWLHTPRALLTALRQQLDVPVVDDPANHHPAFDRVWLRQQLWPLLRQRWPDAEQYWAQLAQRLQYSWAVVAEIQAADWQACRDGQALLVPRLQSLSVARQRQVLLAWLQGDAPYPPPLRRIDTLLGWLAHGWRADAVPELDWQTWRVYAYRERLYRVQLPLPVCAPASAPTTPHWVLPCGVFRVQAPEDDPLRQMAQTLRGRMLGERLQINGKTQHTSLKKLLQSRHVLPWQRDSVCVWQLDQASEPLVLGVFSPQGFWPTQQGQAYLAAWQIEQQQGLSAEGALLPQRTWAHGVDE